jgi:hypothetical protein
MQAEKHGIAAMTSKDVIQRLTWGFAPTGARRSIARPRFYEFHSKSLDIAAYRWRDLATILRLAQRLLTVLAIHHAAFLM